MSLASKVTLSTPVQNFANVFRSMIIQPVFRGQLGRRALRLRTMETNEYFGGKPLSLGLRRRLWWTGWGACGARRTISSGLGRRGPGETEKCATYTPMSCRAVPLGFSPSQRAQSV